MHLPAQPLALAVVLGERVVGVEPVVAGLDLVKVVAVADAADAAAAPTAGRRQADGVELVVVEVVKIVGGRRALRLPAAARRLAAAPAAEDGVHVEAGRVRGSRAVAQERREVVDPIEEVEAAALGEGALLALLLFRELHAHKVSLFVLAPLLLLARQPLGRAAARPRAAHQVDRRHLLRLVAKLVAQLAHERRARRALEPPHLVALRLRAGARRTGARAA